MQRFGGPIIIIAVVALVLIAAVGGGLYFVLGPGTSGPGMTALTSDKNVASHEGLSLSVPPAAVPPDFRIALDSVSANDFAQNSLSDPALTAARTALPSYLTPLSPVYVVHVEGVAPTQMTFALNAAGVGALDTADLYGWDGAAWNFMPARHNGERMVASTNKMPQALAAFQTAATVQVVSTALEVGDTMSEIGSTINVVQVSGLILQADGSLTGGLAGGFAAGQGYAVMPLVRTPNDSGVTLNTMLADINAQRLQIGGLIDLVNSNDYNGVVLDYHGLDPARSAAFTQFVIDLAAALHQQNKSLGIVAPMPTIENTQYTTGGYDLRSIGAAADIIELPLGDDLTVVGNGGAGRMIAWAAGEVSRYKLRLLTSSLSAETVDGAVTRIPASNVLPLFGSATLQTDIASIAPGSSVTFALTGKVQSLDYDPSAFAPRFAYVDDSGASRTVTYVTPETLSHQLALSQKYNLGGVTVRDLFNVGNPSGMLDAVVQFKLKNAAQSLTTSGASISYTITGANGVVYQATAAPGQPFTWTAGDPGQYTIAASFVSASNVALGTVDVVVPQATVAATPTATATLKPQGAPLPTATPCPNCPTVTPVPTKTPTNPPVVVGGGGAWGPFELGGQVVHGGIPHAGEMQRAGMTWVKLQGHYGDDLSAAINNAHAQGFKILLSVVGDRGSVMSLAYQQQFAAYMATLASQGADALEVWNEPNIDREWPTGQVSGANYTALLKVVYPVVKAANSNTIVISAAPAPTGYFGGGCSDAGCDDRPFIADMAASGAANYMDCIGAHYNEGIIPPDQMSGDPRDLQYGPNNVFHSRYYPLMISVYSAAFGATRPVCFTELGYLTGEGYPDLASTAPSFAWASTNTIANQSQWLAQVAQMTKGNANVRFIIVFNIDFTVYGADPQAGYAIIRADGACPACDALDAVMP